MDSSYLRNFIVIYINMYLLFRNGCSYHIETSSFICSVNRWTGFCMTGTSSVMEELKYDHSLSALFARDFHE